MFYFFIGIDDDVHYVYTAQTFATLQFAAFIIISYLYVPNMVFFLCADFFFLKSSVLSHGCKLLFTEQIEILMNKKTSQKQYCVIVFGFEIYCITQYVYIH